MTTINTTLWERSSNENWTSPTSTSLKMLKNLNHDYIVSDIQYSNYAISSDVSVLNKDDDGVGIVFDYIDSNNYKYIMYQGGGLGNYLGDNKPAIALNEVSNGVTKKLKDNDIFSYWEIGSTFEIKLENVFDDITFYVNGIEALKYKKENAISGKIGFVTYSQICEFNNIQMYQSNANRMKAKFVLYGASDSEVLTEIEVKQSSNSETIAEITSRTINIETIDTEIFSIYRGNSTVLTEIQPIGYNNMLAEIEVRPHNRMSALYEIQQPPIIEDIFIPIQDAFTREKSEFQSINYGSSSSLVVGNIGDDIWRSFVKFDTSSINPSFKVIDSHLRLYYKGAVPSNINLEITSIDSDWQEYSITDLNRPIPLKIITNEFSVNTEHGYVDFDVYDIVKNWVALTQENYGFMVRIQNETELGQTTFYSRETVKSPELVVRYFDTRIFSQGRSQAPTEIFVFKRETNDKNTAIEVNSAYSFNFLDTELYVHRKEVPLLFEEQVEITINKQYIPIEITSAIRDVSEALVEISVRTPERHTVDSEISISKPVVLAEITSAHWGEISELVEVSVSRPEIYIEITVPLQGEITVPVEIDINDLKRSVVDAELIVSADKLLVEVSPRVGDRNEVYTLITVSQPTTYAELYVKHRSEVLVEIEPNIKSDVMTELVVTAPTVEAMIVVQRYGDDDLQSEIYVKHQSNIETEIVAKVFNQVETVIDIKKVSQTNVEVVASKPFVNTEIVIPTWVDHDLITAIEPRILMVSNVYTMIQIGTYGGAYAFII